VDRAQQDRVDARGLALLAAALALGEVAEHRQLVGEDVGGGAHGFLGVDRAVGLDVQDQLVQVGALLDAGRFDLVGHAAHRRERRVQHQAADRKSTRLNSSHVKISYAVFCLKKKKKIERL